MPANPIVIRRIVPFEFFSAFDIRISDFISGSGYICSNPRCANPRDLHYRLSAAFPIGVFPDFPRAKNLRTATGCSGRVTIVNRRDGGALQSGLILIHFSND